VVSLTTPPQTNAQGLAQESDGITEETFLKALDAEMAKVEAFTLKKVTELREKIRSTESNIRVSSEDTTNNSSSPLDKDMDGLLEQAEVIAKDFLNLEKYVNINFMGFHKILKKHDKHLPNNPCKAFYVNRMHAQAWVRGDYSDLVVRLSHIYSSLRKDETVKEPGDEANQSFLRSTTKYWIKTEDVSRVKYHILKHLPLFLQKTAKGDSDSQFTNSVYLDNSALELYHGRLDKTPGAIALRLRWYGVGDPKIVFVERKTHNEKWTGEVSVKERFVVRFANSRLASSCHW
jgi:SPX domain protein involved in polyphosphate accumulation